MNYYRELNEGFDRYVAKELGESELLTEDVLNEANPFKAVANFLRGVSEDTTYILDGETVTKDQFQGGIKLWGIQFTDQQLKKLKLGDEVSVEGTDKKSHTFQMITKKITRNDKRNTKTSQANVSLSGKLSDEGTLNIQPIKVAGETQYALFLGKSRRVTIYQKNSQVMSINSLMKLEVLHLTNGQH